MSPVTEQVSRRPRPEALSFGSAFPGGLKKRSQRRPLADQVSEIRHNGR